MKKRLNEYCEELTSTKKLYQEQLRRQLLDNQHDRIELVMEIAKRERGNVYNDITNLIENQERFGLDCLLEYSPSKWLTEQNPVIVRFIKTLTHNENEDQNEGEKLFKCAVAVDAIYGSRRFTTITFSRLVKPIS